VQLDHIKPTLKPPGTKQLKLNCDELLSDFAFNFNLRRYNKVAVLVPTLVAVAFSHSRAVYVEPMKPMLKAPGTKR
jgi:hypothetical protein